MRFTLNATKVLAVLPVLLLFQANLPVSSAGNDVVTPNVTQVKPAPVAATKFSYVIMDVDGFDAADSSWKLLLLEASKDLADLFKDSSRVRLKYLGDTCVVGPRCDKVTIYKDKEVKYRVFIYCNKEFGNVSIDAKKMPDIAKRIAWAISAHDKIHGVGNDKPNP